MTGRVRRRSCVPPSLRDFVRCRSDISRRRPRAPPSLRDFVRCCSDISCRRSRAPPSLRDFVAVASTSPVGGPAHLLLSEISSLSLRHLPPPAAGRCKPEKENQRSSELDADFLFRFAERRRFELLIPFWSIHAFQACLLSHSSISPELPCNTDRAANIRIIC